MKINKPLRILGAFGISELIYIFTITMVVIGIIYLNFSGVASPPTVRLEAYAEGNDIVIHVVSGEVPRGDWQYIVYNVETNPPLIWTKPSQPLSTGNTVVIASNLPPGIYKIIIMHKPTKRIIFEGKIKISG